MIAFIGSVFSPWYRNARASGPDADPFAHCAINIALHSPGDTSWVMTERGKATLQRDATSWRLGGTVWRWHGDRLTIDFDEATRPFFQRMRPRLVGQVTLEPGGGAGVERAIEPRGAHTWRPVAPASRAHVSIEGGPSFSGPAYVDENAGNEGLERGFKRWNWSRMPCPEGTTVLYDVETRAGERLRQGHIYGHDGSVRPLDPQGAVALGSGGWMVPRQTRVLSGGSAAVERTMVAAPFYARSLLRVQSGGANSIAVHETLDMDRFEAPWVRFLLPWRIRREV
ncbi:MAG: carotenoid 1,2-hydratase [Myxococcales bacterium]|nr:carotenoid 1,2-hydratase [Myxococcales bacterium]